MIIFGSLRVDSFLLDQEIEGILMERTDPGRETERIEPTCKGTVFFTEPLPLAARWRITSVFVGDEEIPVLLDFSADRPGLLFLGSLEILRDAEGKCQVRRRAHPSERELLQDLLDAWRMSEWEAVILARVREIQP